jgi:aflatoxin B1 aldehyde reductase
MSATVNPKSALKIVMGAMTFGVEGSEGARVHELKDVETILDIFQSHGHNEVDTARIYAFGTSEEYLGKLNWQGRNLIMDTKHFPHSVISSLLVILNRLKRSFSGWAVLLKRASYMITPQRDCA